MKNRICIFAIIIGITISAKVVFSRNSETQINIGFDEKIKKENVVIILNTYGYIIKGDEPSIYIGETEKYTPLYKNAKIQEYKDSDINKYSDYYIYAKYNNKYAKMKYTNPLVMGSNETQIHIFINSINDVEHLSSSTVIPNTQTIADNSFQEIEKFKENKHDLKMFSYLNKL
ncbi:hypothetical protein [Acinetobacter gerneri]|uniref:hypothetical protein n=1 Tax=Acinetobacter gerneri TaxID=202952 RepID=UPI0028B24427|nr:hypothetical protein [Acinetobacter gerneri]